MNKNMHHSLRPLPLDRQAALIRGEKLFNQGRLEISDCQTLLELFALVGQAAKHAENALTIIARRRAVDRSDVRDGCINVAFGYEELEAGLLFVTSRGVVNWTATGSSGRPITSAPTPAERRLKR